MSRDIYNERGQPGESLRCSPKDTPASQEWGAVALWAGPLPLQGWDTYTGEPSPCPGLLWDTGQCKPFPSPILASFPNNLPLPRLRADCPPRSLQTCRSLGTSHSRGLPPAAVQRALGQPPFRPILPGSREPKAERRGEHTFTEPLFCAKPWPGHLASHRPRFTDRETETRGKYVGRSTQLGSARARVPTRLTPKL